MKLGAGSHLWWENNELSLDYEAAIKDIAELGFYSAELLCDNSFFPGWGTKNLLREAGDVRELLDQNNLKSTIHCPHYDMNLSTWNIGLAKEVKKQLLNCISVASKLESKILVIHPGDVPSKKFPRKGCFKLMVENISKLTGPAADAGVTLCLENHSNTPNSLCITPEEIMRALDEVNSESLKVCLDIAHVKSTGIPFEDFIKPLKKDIRHIHISDSYGGSEHLPIGCGEIDFEKALKPLKGYKGIMTLEGWVNGNRKETVADSREKLTKIIKKNNT